MGPPHVQRRDDGHGQHFFRALDYARGDPDRDQDLQLDRHDVRGQDSLRAANAVLPRLPRAVPDRRFDRHYAGRGAVQLAVDGLVLRGGALPLYADRWHALRVLWGDVLLVSEGVRPHAEPATGLLAFLAIRPRVSLDV